jgi:hypothetical protein
MAQIAIDHTATAGLMSPKTPGAATVSATLAASGGVNGFSRQTLIRFDTALPEIITVQVDNLELAPGGKTHVTAHFSRRVGLVTANMVALFSATNSSNSPVGGFENVTVVQPGPGTTDSVATADFLPGAAATPGQVTIRVGTDPVSVTGSTMIAITAPGG